MILPYAVIFTLVFGLLIYQEQQLIIILVSLVISILFYIHQCIVAKTYGIRKVFSGDFGYQLAFMLWLAVFRVPYFMHYIPLLLSNVGKIYIMAVSKHGEHPSTVQELIIFQNQTETYILLTLLLELIGFSRLKLFKFILYALVVKLKYRFYSPTRKAYN